MNSIDKYTSTPLYLGAPHLSPAINRTECHNSVNLILLFIGLVVQGFFVLVFIFMKIFLMIKMREL